VYADDGTVVGVLKGSQGTDSEHSLMIPIQYATPLTGFLTVQELQHKLDYLTAIIGELADDKPPIGLRLDDLETNVEELKTQYDWTVESVQDGSIFVRYDKMISGGANVDKIKVKITPNMRVRTETGDVYAAPNRPLTIDGGDIIERQPMSEGGRTGVFLIPGVQGKLEQLVGLSYDAVGGQEPFRDLEVTVVPLLDGQPIPPDAADSVKERFSVFPGYAWKPGYDKRDQQ
jgi:hypothetical protein